ncbi:filamentous hemagglutinin N-terminal domain-containing protein [Aquincola sp. S2]|uniref:Filamentous hemagglutinin N-terminal domain-containing protein n=1 Tax=Pseudaquabacterium terrae TaxID=2732868 RepID=A0ABX2EEY0_9BURK|nr:filamentous hemagglutinin N-terminal domain-containing protein [Aquabacterium terrae]NRF67174.1 filamentous hemagglutinin N-terminal domain-containing protein [Aquabacterium terrae]
MSARSERRGRVTAALAAMLFAALPGGAEAGALTDGSWGRTPQAFSGQFTIPESVGRRAGSNLFHSFQRFGIEAGESATFTTATPALNNVIARVSGSEPSGLYGTLRLSAASGSRPNFYLINPNGVTVGPGARIDVPAAFHLSTAHELRFADGTVFGAGRGPDSTLTVAAPAAFGFLGAAAAGAVRLLPGARVNAFLDDRDIDITAGSIELDRAAIHTETGVLRLLAAGAEGAAIPVDPRQAAPERSLGGSITLLGSFASTAEGRVAVQAGTLELQFAAITAIPVLQAAGAVDVLVRDALRLQDSRIASHMAFDSAAAGPPVRVRSLGSIAIGGEVGGILTTTSSAAPAGDISVSAASMSVSGQTAIASFTQALGNAGNIAVDVQGPLRMTDSGGVFSQALAGVDAPDLTRFGASGSVQVKAGALTLDGTGATLPPSISSDSTFVATPAGAVTVLVDGPLVLRGGGNITSSATAHPGFAPIATQRAGSVSVKAQSILIDTASDDAFPSGIYSDSLGSMEPGSLAHGPGGPAGRVQVEARDITILGGGPAGISANTSGPGAGGTVSVTAERMLLDGREQWPASISSTTLGAGDGGVVTVQVAERLTMVRGGLIQALSAGTGRGGAITVEARTLLIEGSGPQGLTTGILGTSVGPGAAGDITVRRAEQVSLLRGGVISANAHAEGRSGAIRIETRDLLIDGQGDPLTGIRSRATATSTGKVGQIVVAASGAVLLTDAPQAMTIKNESLEPDLTALTPQSISVSAQRLQMDGASLIASSSGSAPGNAIDVQVREDMIMRNDARILTSAQNGNGGPISVSAQRYLLIRDAQIESSVLGAFNGNGGNIRVSTPVLVLDNGSIQANTAAPRASGGDIRIEVQALLSSGSALRVGGTELIPFDPRGAGSNVIQAAAPEGLSGNIQIASPALDLAGSLKTLDAQVLDVGLIGRDMCGIGYGSSLVRAGRGGLPGSISDAVRPAR